MPSATEKNSGGTTTWSETFGYDIYGNRWVSATTPAGLETAFTPTASSNFNSSNRLLNNGALYDLSGNQTTIGGYTNTFDAESRLATSTINSITATYSYDGEGRRVQRVTGGVTTQYVYDAQGQLAAEFSAQAPTVTGTEYLIGRPLGSTRMTTNSSGGCLELHDYLPFGEDTINRLGGRTGCYGTSDGVAEKFTGKERDAETGLDYFGARYMSSAQGRFTSVDPAYESEILEYPQTWNRYSYVYNYPLNLTDPDGRCPWCIGAVVGAVVEGSWDLGSQLYQNGGDWSQVSWREVGANTLGGAATGAIAVATGGSSLLADALGGGVANTAGQMVTRTVEGNGTSLGDVGTDFAVGFASGEIGHFAADVIHIPEDPGSLGRRAHAVGRRKLARYNASVADRNYKMGLHAGVGIAASSLSGHAQSSMSEGFWNILEWLIYSPPSSEQAGSTNGTTSKITGCWDMQGNPCNK